MKQLYRVVIPALLVTLMVSACGWCTPTVVREFTLTDYAGSPFRPRIAGDWVVVVQNQDDSGCGSTSNGVLLHNVATGAVKPVYDGAAGWCSIGGTYAAWTGKTNNIQGFCTLKGDRSGSDNRSNLIILDTKDWRYYTPQLSTGPAYAPVMWANYVAYEGKNSQIYLVDMNTGQQKKVSQSDTQNTNPQMGKDFLVWEEHTDKRQIRGYRISTDELVFITDDPGAEHCGCYTDGKTVVWWANGSGVTAYDVATRKSTKISNSGYYADVDDGIVVYLKRGSDGTAVFGYDLAAKAEFRISKGKADCGPAIDGSRVIWCQGNKICCAELDRTGKRQTAK